jgi:hypothetical protein
MRRMTMGDIYCRINGCGEPWDLDCLHELVAENHEQREWYTNGKYDQKKYDPLFAEARKLFREKGCEAFGSRHNVDNNPEAAQLMELAEDLMGDDVDGIVSMLEDAEVMGLMGGGNMD